MQPVTCLICRQRGIPREVFDVPDIYFLNTYPIVECPSCGVKRSLGLPEDVSTLYTGAVYRSREDRKVIRFLKRGLHFLEARRLTKASVSKSFFDVGCGSGDFSRYLFESGFSVVAADAASSRPCDIESCPGISYLHFDYNAVTLEDSELIKGRTVILRHVLEHIADPRMFLQQLAEQGASHFYILVPNASGLSRKIFGKYEGLWGLPFHAWHFNRKSLEMLCKSLGLQVLTSGYETIPIFSYSFHRYLVSKNAPLIFQRIFKPDLLRLVLSFPFDILSLNNVIYVLAKVEQKAGLSAQRP